MPRQDEVFGDGQFILKNLELEPERSHNANLELLYSNWPAVQSDWQITANFFLRKVNDLILLLSATDHTNIYQNVYEANSAGLELSGEWKGWSDRLAVAMNSTYQHFYNRSRTGAFERFFGDRIPNTPYYFANGSIRYAFPALFSDSDKMTLFLSGRYVHQFFLSWESAGIKDFKLEIPSQFINNAGFTYKLPFEGIRTTVTGEIHNLTDAKAFDFLGVQKPGRAFYGKLTVNF
jgi:outer membrane receptor for ferrienterochelin and colicin